MTDNEDEINEVEYKSRNYELMGDEDEEKKNFFDFMRSIQQGDIDRVVYYLQNELVDPSNDYDSAITEACFRGHTEIVRLLLKDERVDPTVDDGICIYLASLNGHTGVVQLLLKDERIDPFYHGVAFLTASKHGRTNVVKLLLEEGIDPSINRNEAIISSSRNGHIDIVKLLLNNSRVNPTESNFEALYLASRGKHKQIVNLLMEWYAENSVPIQNVYNNTINRFRRYILLHYDIDFGIRFPYKEYYELKFEYGYELTSQELDRLNRLTETESKKSENDIKVEDIQFIEKILLMYPYKRSKILRLLNLPNDLSESLISKMLDDYLPSYVSSIIAQYLD
jgi:ankyrin repeat protein